jgi:nucleoid DNA-binding protein
MNRAELIARIYAFAPDDLQKKDVEFVANLTLDVLSVSVNSGEEVKIRGLGSWRTKLSRPRKHYDIHTGKTEAIPAVPRIRYEHSKAQLLAVRGEI